MIKIARHQAFDLAEFFLYFFLFFSGLPTERVRDSDLRPKALQNRLLLGLF